MIRIRKARASALLFGFLLTFLAACEPTIANRGALIDPDKLAEIKVGVSTREDVATKLGTPTQVSTFDEKTWYYFGRTTEQTAFFDPEVVKQQAVEIHFNDDGVVTALNQLDPSGAPDIDPVARATPTYGHEMTFFEQLVGNVSHRDDKDKDKK
jgi:outer membrane protein assembly factor BamE (lipoprotein component of BamABCDE complex)